MRHLLLLPTLLFLLTLAAVASLPAQIVGNQPADLNNTRETIVYPVRAGSAPDLAESLRRLYEDQNIIAQVEQNLLLIRVDAKTKGELLGVLSKLDQPKKTIVVRAYLLKSHGAPLSTEETTLLSGSHSEVFSRIAAMQQQDQLSIGNRIELTAIENQRAMVQVGQQIPVLSGVSVSGSRGRTNNYQTVQVGTLFTVTARTTPDDDIVMEINFEKSEVEQAQAPADDAAPTPAIITSLTHQATVQLKSDEAVLAGTMIGRPKEGAGHAYLVVTAKTRSLNTRRAVAAKAPAVSLPEAATDRRVRSPAPDIDPFSRSGSPVGQSPAGAVRRGPTRQMPLDVFERIASSTFEREDRDKDGLLSGDELEGRFAKSALQDVDVAKYVTFAQFRSALAARLGVADRLEAKQSGQPKEKQSAPKLDASSEKRSNANDRYLSYVTRLISRYDKDDDGKLSRQEWAKMNTSPAAADVNEDGLITVEELGNWYRNNN